MKVKPRLSLRLSLFVQFIFTRVSMQTSLIIAVIPRTARAVALSREKYNKQEDAAKSF